MGRIYSTKQSKIADEPSIEYSKSEKCYIIQILGHLKSLASQLRFFGVFFWDIKVDEDTDSLVLKVASKGWLIYGMIIWLITTGYIVFQAVSLVLSILNGDTIIKILVQFLWTNPALLTYCVSLFLFIRRFKIVKLFRIWNRIEKEFESLFCPIRTKFHILIFRLIYCSLAILSITLQTYHVIKHARYPVYLLHYYPEFSGTIYHAGYAFFHTLLTGWIWAGLIVLEGICCVFSTVFIQCMDTLIVRLESAVLNKNKSNRYIKNSNIRPTSRLTVHSLVTNLGMGQLSPIYEKDPFKSISSPVSSQEKEEYILFAIQKMQTIACLQSKINNVIGPLLLLDVAHLVLLSCALTFLPFRLYELVDPLSTLLFTVNGISVLIRLIILITSMGNVYSKGQEVNVALAKVMSFLNLSSYAQNPVLAHLTVFSSNPICFTAWGFFPITRSTLLAAFSLISTYGAILIQLNV